MTKNKGLFLILFSIGSFFILLPFIGRLVIVRLPKDIQNISIYFSILMALTFSIMILRIIYLWIKAKYFKNKPSNIIFVQLQTRLIKPIITKYWLSLSTVDNYIKDNLLSPYLGPILLRISEFLLFSMKLQNRTSIQYKIIFISLDILPKSILLLIFGIDVLLYHQLHYIYVFSGILLIPLIFTFREFSEFNIKLMNDEILVIKSLENSHLTTEDLLNECTGLYRVDTIGSDNAFTTYRKIFVREEYLPDSPEESNKILITASREFEIYMSIRKAVYQFEKFPFYWTFLNFNFLFYLSYLCLWLYILFLPECYFLLSMQDNMEPFSQLYLVKYVELDTYYNDTLSRANYSPEGSTVNITNVTTTTTTTSNKNDISDGT
jgi:hypothetical protein